MAWPGCPCRCRRRSPGGWARSWACGWSRWCRAARLGTAGIYLGDILVTAGGEPVQSVQVLQRLMLGPAIGTDLPVTVLRKNAFVDVVTVPTELS
nr:hypothetical protein GCM10020092_097530 [Actinoplanes digitatis]